MTKVRAVLVDLSGTLHVGDTPIEGAINAIQRLKDASIPLLFVTNTTKLSSQALHQQLHDMGFPIHSRDEIMTSTLAARTFLQQHDHLRPYCLLAESTLRDDFEGYVPTQPPYNCVVVGLAPSKFNYEHLNRAFGILQQQQQQRHSGPPSSQDQPPAALIAIHKGMYYREAATAVDTDSDAAVTCSQKGQQQLSLGPGGFVACLEQAAKTEAVVIGKPNPAFYRAAIAKVVSDAAAKKESDDGLALSPSHVCMVGDDVQSDLCGAHEVGIGTTILVQTGKYQAGDENLMPTNTDSIVVPSIVEAVDYVLQHYNE